jgi:uncharacterized protein
MQADSRTDDLRVLPADTCLGLLAQMQVGRLAFQVDGDPDGQLDVVLVNYLLDGDEVVLRTRRGGRLAALLDGASVAFQVDDLQPETRSGWSVVVRGRARVVDDADELQRLRALQLRSWAPGERDCYVRIAPARITGRELEAEGETSTIWLG